MPKYQSTKTYGTDRGLSCCFRQWRASHSHCSTLHGYSLGFKFVFESETLDSRNWAFDFGGMKPIKEYLDYMFDHTVLVAKDDPLLHNLLLLGAASSDPTFQGQARDESNKAHQEGRLCDIRMVDGVGCELTAKMVYEKSAELLEKMKNGEDTRYEINPDVRLVSVECFEHGANSAIYYGDTPEAEKVSVMDATYNPLTMVDDYFFAVKKLGTTLGIELPGFLSKEEIISYMERLINEVHQRKMPKA